MGSKRLLKKNLMRFRRFKCAKCLLLCAAGLISVVVGYSVIVSVKTIVMLEIGQRSNIHPPSVVQLAKNYEPRSFSGKKKSLYYDSRVTYRDFDYRKPGTLGYTNKIYADDIQILFRFPKLTSVSAVLLIFHSCRQTAYEWFHTPERQRIIGAALQLGYACLVFQARDKINRCWSNNADIYENIDVQMVFKGLEGFYKEHGNLGKMKISFLC